MFTKAIQPRYGPIPLQGLATSILPLALAAVAQAIVVISGGIDLSIGSMMALTSVVSASMMKGQSDEFAIVVVVLRPRSSASCSGRSTAASSSSPGCPTSS